MRILMVTHRFLPRYLAGVEVYAAGLSRGLRARGHSLEVLTGDPQAAAAYRAEWDGLPLRVLPWGLGGRGGPVGTFLAGLANPAADAAFRRACADFRPDVVHVHHLLGLSPNLPAIARRLGIPVVITLHDYWFACSNTWLFRYSRQRCPGPGYHCGGCALHRLGRPPQPALMALSTPLFAARTGVLRRSLLAAYRLIAPSNAVAAAYTAHGIDAARIMVIPHGLAEGESVLSAPATPAPAAARFILLGSLIPPKGVDVAIRAFIQLDAPDAELHIYGDETADPGYAAELRALAAHPGIAFKGPAARDTVAGVLANATALLLPSLWDEPYALVVDEAQAAGLPLLVSANGAPAERLRPGVDGLTAPAGDVDAWRAQMQRLAAEPGLAAALRRAAPRPKALDAHAEEIEALYGELAGTR